MNKELAADTNLSHYRIVRKLGAGGMGEVYLAEDLELERQVALKVLLAEVAADEDRVRRFVQEAKAASALNHPNILTVHEIGTFENSRFIATELIKGETLRERLRSEPLELRETLDITLQIAAALNAAHSAGIVHRDIKPENVMIRDDGFVKVLDFGLAKLTEKKTQTLDTEGETRALEVKTLPGMVMGTVAYMSPEQARGKETDARSDVWSLGVVVYEMLTKQTPFAGETTNDTIAAILVREPAPLSENAPQELQRIIKKSLQKDKNERYQTIKDFLLDVKNLKRELEFADELERSQIQHSSKGRGSGASESNENATAILPAAISTQNSLPQATSSAEYIVSEVKKHKLGLVFGSIILLGLIGLGYWYFAGRAAGSKQIESIAVMPFVNQSSNADVEYLSDGMTETLINSLSNLPNLNVKPRSSVFRYKGKEYDPQTFAKELNVQAILNGRVVQRGQDISLFVELIDISLDKVVWSETYNRKQTDLVALQTDIARDVSGKIKNKLSGEDIAKVTKTYTTNPEAYQLYLKGNFYLTKYTEEGYRKGIEYYQKAIAIDPNYALAYHGIAAAYDFANGYYLPSNESEPKAKAAATKALELDETLAETHFLLGKIVFWYEWDWATAERHWKRANELDPTYPVRYPIYLSAMGRFDEAAKAQEVVLQRLPLDLNMKIDSAGIFLAAGRYDQSIEQTRKALELDPSFWWAYQFLGLAYERKKQYEEAVAALEKARQGDINPSSLGYLGYVYAAAGKKVEAQKVLEELKGLLKQRYVSPYNIACVYAGLNDKDQAFEWLERAYQDRSYYMTLLKTETVLDNLRPDPRFKDLLRRMNLPE
jgi:serine/threonine protein kinase/Tfp pilus assembly protein PilF